MRRAHLKNGVGRGVWAAPWMGPNGETILVAVGRDDRIVAERRLAPGDPHVRVADELWVLLDKHDPMPVLRII